MSRRSLLLFALSAILLLLSPNDEARAGSLRHRLALSAGGEGWLDPETGGHGYVAAAYDLDGLPRGSRLSALFNTDTLRLRYGGLKLLGGRLELGGYAGGELMFAGLLMDYYRQGERLVDRGFTGSWVEGGLDAKLILPGHSSVELGVGVRRWFFRRGDAAAELVLPPEALVLEPRLSYTFWWLRDDPSLGERHRPFRRLRGVAGGVRLALDVRSETAPWGALDGATFSPTDTRNDAERTSLLVHQWLIGGVQLHDRLRVQGQQHAIYGHGTDDLNRVRLGGLNPFVVPLAGAPWAAYVVDRAVAGELGAYARLFGEAELGLLADLAWIDDIDRTGASDGDLAFGLGVHLDWRIGSFQIDVRGGWSPTLDARSSSGQLTIFGAAGWQWQSR